MGGGMVGGGLLLKGGAMKARPNHERQVAERPKDGAHQAHNPADASIGRTVGEGARR